MLDRTQPTTIRGLREFLGLMDYHRKFISKYEIPAAPIKDMLQKNSFQQAEKSLHAFVALKQAMTVTPVLVLPDFTQSFEWQQKRPYLMSYMTMPIRHSILMKYQPIRGINFPQIGQVLKRFCQRKATGFRIFLGR